MTTHHGSAEVPIDQIMEIVHQSHGPVPGEPLWRRNYKTGLLESTCLCGDVLAIPEEYEPVGEGWGRYIGLKHAGKAWYDHHDEKIRQGLAALLSGSTEVKAEAAKAEALRGLLALLPTQSGTPAGDAHDREGWVGLVRWYIGVIEDGLFGYVDTLEDALVTTKAQLDKIRADQRKDQQ